MKFVLMAAVVSAGLSHAALAAHAGAPYVNVDRRNDAGNDTGDSQVDRLNEQQLDRNYRGPYYPSPSAIPSYQAPPPAYEPASPPPYAPRYYRRPAPQRY